MTSEALRAGVSANASSEWVVFTGKLPQAIKARLKIAAAKSGKKQQELLAEAVTAFLDVKGL
ncbi:hypothetical protein NAD41_002371 [Salmonella enterica]|nr:hypothetical protein [Salmonella enterica]EKK6596339.1 hypothetical protein [Salmonella enterica]